MTEHYIQISREDTELSAIIHPGTAEVGVLIVVGGPQYRVGSHRQFVKLSRVLAEHTIPSMRLDTSGMGDSSGKKAPFYNQTADINAAIDAFFSANNNIKHIVLWGLCDAASAILIKLNQQDTRIAGVVLLNPWVRQQQSHAQTMLKHYYLKRLFSKAFWRKLLGGGLAIGNSVKGLWQTVQQSKQNTKTVASAPTVTEQNYVAAMLSGWQSFNGQVQVITSGNDLTAEEFLLLCNSEPAWQHCLKRADHINIAGASHTFSSAKWRQEVETACVSFVERIIARQ